MVIACTRRLKNWIGKRFWRNSGVRQLADDVQELAHALQKEESMKQQIHKNKIQSLAKFQIWQGSLSAQEPSETLDHTLFRIKSSYGHGFYLRLLDRPSR